MKSWPESLTVNYLQKGSWNEMQTTFHGRTKEEVSCEGGTQTEQQRQHTEEAPLGRCCLETAHDALKIIIIKGGGGARL